MAGFVLFAAFAIIIELALEWGGADYPWNSSVIIGLLCGGCVSLLLFALWELRAGDRAMIPPSVVRRREVWASSLYLGMFSGAMLVFSYYMPIYFQAVKGVSALLSGVYMLAGIGPQIFMAIFSGAVSKSSSKIQPVLVEIYSVVDLFRIHSWKDEKLPTLGLGQCCACCAWCWSDDYLDCSRNSRAVGHVSIRGRAGARLWYANSEYLHLLSACLHTIEPVAGVSHLFFVSATPSISLYPILFLSISRTAQMHSNNFH